ncbi:hypothetical protein TPELB_33180 [Terrisporobacter petrolearius]|uniref:ATPase dynein-related AAA domain-containing protein n=1 Tax=Terrisporobacter petrolearius TaxID=1460447 RepID=A0ABZ3FJ87_9FIRM
MERIPNTSWFVDSDNKVVKLCDKTALKEANTILPMDRIKDFFDNRELQIGQAVTANIEFIGELCEVVIKKYNNKTQGNPSTYLSWKGNKIDSYIDGLENISLYNYKGVKNPIDINDYARMEFTKNKDGVIKLDIVNKSKSDNFIFKKIIDKSTFKYGITIPKTSEKKFLENTKNKTVKRGESQEISIMFNDYRAKCRLTSPDRKGSTHEVLQIRYDSNKDLRKYLLDSFEYTEEDIENEKIKSKESLEFYSTEEENIFHVKINTGDNVNDIYEIDKNKIIHINQYIKNEGYDYSYEQISNLYLSLKTKPFVILAGISGTGKSKIVRLFAQALGATIENNQYNMISVRPDWNDSTELIGYKNLESKFIKGKLTQIIEEASQHLDKPYFICLDEMNLARVEYYLSDYLSVIESRRKEEDIIVTDSLIYDYEIEDENSLKLPENIYLIGTVNMDDTTFQFSRKVLDRANTIEFSDVSLESLFENESEEVEEISDVYNDFLKSNYLKTVDIEQEYRNYAKEINRKIIEINNILSKSQKQFAYRVRDEILFYMIENKKADLLSEDAAFDYQIMQKVLPAINGSENSIKEILINLFNFICEKEILNDSDIDEAENYLQSANVKYRKSAEKIVYMLKGYNYDGYASYWY